MRHPTLKEKALEQMIRVNQAGEYGATRIYAGQMAILGKNADLDHMAAQEANHLKAFNQLVIEHRIRPTFLQPVWSVAGFALGALTACLGEKAAHACTIAVETVIDEHYQDQLKTLESIEGVDELRQTIQKCHKEELEHRETAIAKGGQDAFGYEILSTGIKTASRLAIWLSKRL